MYLLVTLDKSHGPFLGGYEASCGEGAGGVQGRQWGGKGWRRMFVTGGVKWEKQHRDLWISLRKAQQIA